MGEKRKIVTGHLDKKRVVGQAELSKSGQSGTYKNKFYIYLNGFTWGQVANMLGMQNLRLERLDGCRTGIKLQGKEKDVKDTEE